MQIQDLERHPRAPGAAADRDSRGARRHPRQVRRQAPHRDRPGPFGSHDRRPDRAAGRGRDAVARRLREGAAGDGLSGAASRRPRQGGDGGEGRGFRRQAVRRQHARHAAVLLEHRQAVLAQGVPAAAGEPRLARQADREPAAAAGRRAHQRGAADPRVRREQVRVHGRPRRAR